MITAVGGHGGYPGGKQFISAEELRQKLSHLRHDKVLIVKLVVILHNFVFIVPQQNKIMFRNCWQFLF
jgi:hypothetical protein